ncbi:MAG TPA: winged helix-turn-helix domain-containing protein, partial [Candidatus Acidoferrum sp.]|nr:winged helix-turn-helix domain-containing protein [Candidatus Acidoferrum sp.]
MEVLLRSRRVTRFGPFDVDLRAGELRKRGLKIRLQQQPFRVLALLLEHPGEVVTREELRQAIWPADTFVDFDEGLDATIYKLRNALGDSSENPRFVETLPRRGYRFITPVEEVVPKTSRVRNLLTFVGVLTAVVLALFLGLNLAGLRDRLLRRSSERRIRSLLVLPLRNLSGDPSQDYFVDGMTDALITNLSKISALRVISHTSVNHFKGTKKPLHEIAAELQVDAVVEGSVEREADRVRITANLVQVFPEKHLWAESYDRDLRSILDLESEVARTIADQIRITVTPEELRRMAVSETVDPEAHELYLKGA